MKSKLTATHKWVLLALAFVLVNAAVWFLGLSPTLGNVEALRINLNQAQQRRDQLQHQLEHLVSIDAVSLEEQWQEVNPRVPDRNLLREFIHGLVDMARDMGMPLPSISISSPSTSAPFYSVSLSTSIKGSYDQLKAFLIALEEHERLILVRYYSFNGEGDELNCSVSFTIFAEEYGDLTPYEAPGRDNPFQGQ